MNHRSGRHFLQIPGPTNVPDRVLRAIDRPTIDHRGPEFGALGREAYSTGMQAHFPDHAAGGHLSRVGHRRVGGGARQHAVAGRPRADVRDRPFRHAVARHGSAARSRRSTSFPAIGAMASMRKRSASALADDRDARDQGGLVVHNETSTGVTSRIPRCAARSTAPGIRRCCWSTRFRRSARSTIATTSGASTSRSPARRRA